MTLWGGSFAIWSFLFIAALKFRTLDTKSCWIHINTRGWVASHMQGSLPGHPRYFVLNIFMKSFEIGSTEHLPKSVTFFYISPLQNDMTWWQATSQCQPSGQTDSKKSIIVYTYVVQYSICFTPVLTLTSTSTPETDPWSTVLGLNLWNYSHYIYTIHTYICAAHRK